MMFRNSRGNLAAQIALLGSVGAIGHVARTALERGDLAIGASGNSILPEAVTSILDRLTNIHMDSDPYKAYLATGLLGAGSGVAGGLVINPLKSRIINSIRSVRMPSESKITSPIAKYYSSVLEKTSSMPYSKAKSISRGIAAGGLGVGASLYGLKKGIFDGFGLPDLVSNAAEGKANWANFINESNIAKANKARNMTKAITDNLNLQAKRHQVLENLNFQNSSKYVNDVNNLVSSNPSAALDLAVNNKPVVFNSIAEAIDPVSIFKKIPYDLSGKELQDYLERWKTIYTLSNQ